MKTTKKTRWISLRVSYNPETGEIRCPAFIEPEPGTFEENPISREFRAAGRPQAVRRASPDRAAD